MAQMWARIILLGLVACSASVVSQAQVQELPQPPDLPSLNPASPSQVVLFPEPPSMPLSPDAPIPDLGAIQGTPDKSHSVINRAIDRAKPNCIDAVVHTCWSSPPGDATTGLSKESREFLRDMELGTYYFKKKNYRGAAFRFRHALENKPGHPEATFKLAESLDKLNEREDAKENYQTYIESEPSGPYAEQARAALQKLSPPANNQ